MVLEDGRAIDGGNNHYSVGTCEFDASRIDISLAVEYHGTPPRAMLGSVKIAGTLRGSAIEGSTHRADLSAA